MIGPTFGDEVIAAGLGGLPFAWGSDGQITGRENLTDEQNKTLDAVVSAHDPKKQLRRFVPKSVIIGRLSDAQLDAALAVLTNRQKERWRAPDHPAVYSDDPEMLAVLAAVGADAAAVLA